MKKFRSKRLTRMVASCPIGTRVPQELYDRIEEEAYTAGVSIAALLCGHLTVLYEDEAYNERIRGYIVNEPHISGLIIEPAPEKPLPSMFAEMPEAYDPERDEDA